MFSGSKVERSRSSLNTSYPIRHESLGIPSRWPPQGIILQPLLRVEVEVQLRLLLLDLLLDKVSDAPTADLLTQRMQTHVKTAWMLRSLLAA